MIQKVKKYRRLYIDCQKSDSNFIYLILRMLYYRIVFKKKLFLHQKVYIKGVKNIKQSGDLKVGLDYFGFSHKTDKTILKITGKLILKGDYRIGKGCRFDIDGTMIIGKNCYVSPNTVFIIMHTLTIGDNTIISWNCQFLDDDFHTISYLGKNETEKSIKIGNHVWIGCGVKVYKGTSIANNCVVASDSIVKGIYLEENCLIGGNPSRVIKRNIQWS